MIPDNGAAKRPPSFPLVMADDYLTDYKDKQPKVEVIKAGINWTLILIRLFFLLFGLILGILLGYFKII